MSTHTPATRDRYVIYINGEQYTLFDRAQVVRLLADTTGTAMVYKNAERLPRIRRDANGNIAQRIDL